MFSKKILIVFADSGFSDRSFDSALKIARKSNSMLTGVFLQDMSYLLLNTNLGLDPQPFEFSLEVFDELNREETAEIKKAVTLFMSRCREAGVAAQVHLDKGIPLHETVKESSYADLLIFNFHPGASDQGNAEGDLLDGLLSEVKCPVLVLPAQAVEIKSIAFVGGHGSHSAKAFREFLKLFNGEFPQADFYFYTNEQDTEIRKLQLEYLLFHLPKTEVRNFDGSEDHLLKKLKEEKDLLLVMHYHSKNVISQLWGSNSMAKFLNESGMPLFISID